MHNVDLFYGQKVYRFDPVSRLRYLIGLRPTMRPYPAETNEDFEGRMARCVEALYATGALNVEATFELRADAILECHFVVELTPELAPVIADSRPAGGSVSRGVRGTGTSRIAA